MKITPKNLTAQTHFRATGNPPTTTPLHSVSNCYPGLEIDLRSFWTKMFEGITLHEVQNRVISVESDDPNIQALRFSLLQSAEVAGNTIPLNFERADMFAEFLRENGGRIASCTFAPAPAAVSASSSAPGSSPALIKDGRPTLRRGITQR